MENNYLPNNREPQQPAAPTPTAPINSAPVRKRKRLTRDQRRDILLLRSLDWTYEQIQRKVPGVTYAGVQYTCQLSVATPGTHPGRPSGISEKQLDEIMEFIGSSLANRQMTYKKVLEVLQLPFHWKALTRALRGRGFRRLKCLQKPLAIAPGPTQ